MVGSEPDHRSEKEASHCSGEECCLRVLALGQIQGLGTLPALFFLVACLLLGLRFHQGLHSSFQQVFAESLVYLGNGVS